MSFKKELLNAVENDPIFAMRLSNAIGSEMISGFKTDYYAESESFNISNLEINFKEFSEEDIKQRSLTIFVKEVRKHFDDIWNRFPDQRSKHKSCRNLYSTFFKDIQEQQYLTCDDLVEDIKERAYFFNLDIEIMLRQNNKNTIYDVLCSIEEDGKRDRVLRCWQKVPFEDIGDLLP